MTITEPRRAHQEAPRAGRRQWAALAVLMLPVLLVSVDNTVLAFALPQIALTLEPTGVQQLWIVDAYSLVLATLLVTMGVAGDRFGRRRMLLIGATGFAVLSAATAFAPTAGWLIAGRAATAVFGAMLMPATLSLIRTTFVHRDQRRLAVAVWAAMFSAGAALGPIAGGLLLEHFAWGSIFLLAVPVLVPLLILGPLLIAPSRDPHPGRIDVGSVLLSMAALLPAAYGIKEMAARGPQADVIATMAVGILFGMLFVRRQRRLTNPMIDMGLFRHGPFTGAILVNLLSVVALVGFLFFVAQHLQLIVGLSPLDAGLLLVPSLAAMIVAGLAVVPISARLSPRIVIPVALAFSFGGYLTMALTASPDVLWPVVLASVSLGVGVGAAETVTNELILTSAPPAKAGAASAISETAYELGTVLGTSVIGGILTAVYRGAIVLPDGLTDAAAHAARETLAGAIHVADQIGGAAAAALREAAAVAFDAGMGAAAALGAGLVVMAAVIAAATLRGSRTTK